MARGNGEGTIYNTIQKQKRAFDNSNMCKICRLCIDRSLCNNRKDWSKCEKCQNCSGNKDCDRFYIYQRAIAQISTPEGRKTVANGKTKKEVNKKKEEKERILKMQERVKFGDLTLEEAMIENEKQKLLNKEIIANSYNRNLETINSICFHKISKYLMKNITLDDIREAFTYFVDVPYSQSYLEKIYYEMHGAFRLCKLETMEEIKANTYLSEVDSKEVVAFTVAEEEKLLSYINNHENNLVSHRCSIDSKTAKNIIKISLATAMRIGETCSLDKDISIYILNKRFIVKTTLTQDSDKKIIIGKTTKTGRKKKKAGKKDVRIIPFDVLFDEEEIISILNEQYEITNQISNNINNLLFCTKEGKPISHNTFNNIFKRICRSAEVGLDLPKGCHTHMMKHTGVTRMIENGIRIEAISAIVGTSVEVLRETYAHILDDFIEKEIQKSIINRNKNLSLN